MGDNVSNILSKEDLEEIVKIQVSRRNLSKSQKYDIYKAIKRDIVANKVPPERYHISKHKNTKDFQIDPCDLSVEVLLEILYITNYK